MDVEQIKVIHRSDTHKSYLTLPEYPTFHIPFHRHLDALDTVDDAIDKIRETLQILANDNDLPYLSLLLRACDFGHLSLPNIVFKHDANHFNSRVTIHVESAESIAERRAENRAMSDTLIGFTLEVIDDNPHAIRARSSITDVVHASFCSEVDFISAFDWTLQESLSLWFYFRTIAN